MKNQPSPVELLFRKWINGQATKEEEAELLQLLGKSRKMKRNWTASWRMAGTVCMKS